MSHVTLLTGGSQKPGCLKSSSHRAQRRTTRSRDRVGTLFGSEPPRFPDTLLRMTFTVQLTVAKRSLAVIQPSVTSVKAVLKFCV